MKAHSFRERSAAATSDDRLIAAISKTAEILLQKRAQAVEAEPGFEEMRAEARKIKAGVVEDLGRHAQLFAEKAAANGTKVHFARDAADVGRVVGRLALGKALKSAVKSKSMTTEELGFEEIAHAAGIEVTETDLGEFIIQLAGEKPSHIMAPAIHRDRAQIAGLFHEKIGTAPGLDVEGLVAAARGYLRERFLAADLGITGANFLIAETGSVVLVTNEGNGRFATSLPRIHLVIAGLDKLIPTLADLPLFLGLLTRSASGQSISTYVTMTTGPKKEGDTDGPEEVHVVFVDNGRTSIARSPCFEMLFCLHCGACLNHCPVYRAAGGHAWSSPYPGPMGSVLSPLIWGVRSYPDLPDACTLCGRCREACPMSIPLPEFHLRLRSETKSPGLVSFFVSRISSTPALYRFAMARLRRILKSGRLPRAGKFASNWALARAFPKPDEGVPFREWWEKRKMGDR